MRSSAGSDSCLVQREEGQSRSGRPDRNEQGCQCTGEIGQVPSSMRGERRRVGNDGVRNRRHVSVKAFRVAKAVEMAGIRRLPRTLQIPPHALLRECLEGQTRPWRSKGIPQTGAHHETTQEECDSFRSTKSSLAGAEEISEVEDCEDRERQQKLGSYKTAAEQQCEYSTSPTAGRP